MSGETGWILIAAWELVSNKLGRMYLNHNPTCLVKALKLFQTWAFSTEHLMLIFPL